MIKNMKKWLGIEGVKMELSLPEEISKKRKSYTAKYLREKLKAEKVHDAKSQ